MDLAFFAASLSIFRLQKTIGTHTLRKTFGYHAFQQSVDITIIQRLLNHSSPRITLAYIGITQDDLGRGCL
ncbi:tyrosine-type recombinase/integrase [Paenibacillus sp. IB182493]|uniref:Tyrosine-type recombinase/integrase n=1 Tax=Paenibacillus arenilitoris TaxID=2772299 RepID=A0A927H6Y3_9BACL|nr:tyrosine-type recombinase/integrase [Paenibacillus arenilitoris]